jgi:hypothetical protein
MVLLFFKPSPGLGLALPGAGETDRWVGTVDRAYRRRLGVLWLAWIKTRPPLGILGPVHGGAVALTTCCSRTPCGSMSGSQTRTVFGPFHRLVAPKVQDTETVIKQLLSGEIWGRPARWGHSPTVKAYAGALTPGETGIEFWSFQPPASPHAHRVYWRTSGRFVTIEHSNDVAKLQVAFVRITQDLLP